MIFKQNKKDGSCEIIFTENEIKILNEKKTIYLDAVSLRHFGNTLVKMVAEWNMNFNDELKFRQTIGNEIVEGTDGEGNK